MLQRIVLVLALSLSVTLPTALLAQDEPNDPELAFVNQLRLRGYADLALEYLEKRLSKNPKYAADLPLEIAQTHLALAASEADGAKRIGMFDQARLKFEDFIAKHPEHRKIAVAKFQMAQVSALQGKAQLARALALPDGDESRASELNRALQMLENAEKGLDAVADQLKSDDAKNQSALERGQLILAQAKAQLTLGKDMLVADLVKKAVGVLEPLADKLEAKDPLKGLALAWCGRAFSLGAEPKKADFKFKEVRNTFNRTAHRLVDFFEMQAKFEDERGLKPEDRLKLIQEGTAWLSAYRQFQKTPEGYGVQYILAKQYFALGAEAKGQAQTNAFNTARNFIHALEASDNEYTALAQQIKIDMLIVQEVFKRNINTLTKFEDCYMRALYEHSQLQKNEKGKFDKEEAKKAEQKLILDLLNKALGYAYNVATDKSGKVDVQKLTRERLRAGVQPEDLRNTWYLLAGYYMTLKQYPDVVTVGSKFAQENPRARNANVCAMFAAQALTEIIQSGGGKDDPEAMPEEREKLFKLGQLMADRWPGDRAGELGRYLISMQYIKRAQGVKDPKERAAREEEAIKVGGDSARYALGLQRAKDKDFKESIILLRPLQVTFPNYPLAQYQIALAAIELDKDNKQRKERGEPPVELPNDKRAFKDIAQQAFESIPDPTDLSNGELVSFYLRAKTRLGFMFYPNGQYDKMEQLVAKLQKTLTDGGKALQDKEKATFHLQLNSIKLYALYGKADVAYKANNFAGVAKMLEPFVNELKANAYPELKEDTRLLNALLGLAFRSNLQVGNVSPAKQILDVWKTFEKEGESTVANVLQASVVVFKKQIEELRKKGEKDKLAKTVTSFKALLNEVKNEKSLTAELLAQCYTSIGDYAEATKQLEKSAEPQAKANATAEEQEKFKKDLAKFKRDRVMLIRCKRLDGKENKKPKAIEEAKKLLDEIMVDPADPKKPGWGRRDLNALEEEILLLIDIEAFGAAVNRANALLGILLKKLPEGGTIRDHYFRTAYHYVYALTYYGLKQTDAAKTKTSLQRAASYYKKLVTAHPTLGGEEHKERFQNFLATPEGAKLKEAMDDLDKEKTR
jgi:hypothetical protein